MEFKQENVSAGKVSNHLPGRYCVHEKIDGLEKTVTFQTWQEMLIYMLEVELINPEQYDSMLHR